MRGFQDGRERCVFMYWSQGTRNSARKRGDKRLSVELVEDAGCGEFAIIELGII